MSKRNYTNYSKKNENVEPEVTETVETTDVKMEPEVTEVIETINIVAPVVEAVPEIPKIGTVSGCAKLNVRRKPVAGSDVISVIDAGTVVEIDEANSTADWYKVIVPAVNEGYCMRKFITVQ